MAWRADFAQAESTFATAVSEHEAGVRAALAVTPRGLYIWGDVGTGKSMLMDLFYETCELPNGGSGPRKRRVHFHQFMLEVCDSGYFPAMARINSNGFTYLITMSRFTGASTSPSVPRPRLWLRAPRRARRLRQWRLRQWRLRPWRSGCGRAGRSGTCCGPWRGRWPPRRRSSASTSSRSARRACGEPTGPSCTLIQRETAFLVEDMFSQFNIFRFGCPLFFIFWWLLTLQVTDVADALLMVQFFDEVWRHGTVVVATSNRPPTDLYANGLNRAYFLPFIANLERRCAVHSLAPPQAAEGSSAEREPSEAGASAAGAAGAAGAPVDYRRLSNGCPRPGAYSWPLEPVPHARLLRALVGPGVGPSGIGPQEVPVMMGRRLRVAEGCLQARVCRLSFDDICGRDLGAADYKVPTLPVVQPPTAHRPVLTSPRGLSPSSPLVSHTHTHTHTRARAHTHTTNL